MEYKRNKQIKGLEMAIAMSRFLYLIVLATALIQLDWKSVFLILVCWLILSTNHNLKVKLEEVINEQKK